MSAANTQNLFDHSFATIQNKFFLISSKVINKIDIIAIKIDIINKIRYFLVTAQLIEN